VQARTGHEKDSVNAAFPVVFQHLLGLAKEDLCLLARGSALLLLELLGLEEDLGFRDESTDESGEGRNACTKVEEAAPAVMGDDGEVDDGGDEVATGVTLLENATGETTKFNREVF